MLSCLIRSIITCDQWSCIPCSNNIIIRFCIVANAAIYNTSSYEEQRKTGIGFANPENNFFSFYNGDILVGFSNLYEEDTEMFFGIGVNPAFCNRGYGQQITKQTISLSHTLYPDKPLYLEVRTWNKHAVRCYEKAGFKIVGEPIRQSTHIGEGTFYHMLAE